METPASIRRHPIHLMLVPIPIGAWIFALVADFVGYVNGDPSWQRAAYYAIGVGIVGALLAAVPGLIDLLSLPPGPTRRTGIVHMTINLVAVAVFVLIFGLRWDEPAHDGSPLLTLLGVLLISVSGWLGGELVHRSGVGVATDAETPSTQPRDRFAGRPLDVRSH
jgi:uncharacterized membrane protein